MQRTKMRGGLGRLKISPEAPAWSHEGELLAWWPGWLSLGTHVPGIPMAEMIFRRLHPGDHLGGFVRMPIELAQLGLFRHGTIWKDAKCIADTVVGNEYVGYVDYNKSSLTSRSANPNDIPFADAKFLLPNNYSSAWLIELPPINNSGVTILVPCMEFFVRCYGSNKSIPVAIAHEFDLNKFCTSYAEKRPPNNTTWAMRVSSKIKSGDINILAHFLHDSHAQHVIKKLNSQIRVNRANGHKTIHPMVEPWFKGHLRIGGKGIWLEQRKFLCLDVTHFEPPPHPPLEVIYSKFDRLDGESGYLVPKPSAGSSSNKPENEIDEPDEPPLTSIVQPNNINSPRSLSDGTLNILGLNQNKIYTSESKAYGGHLPVPPRAPAEKLSTGHQTNSGGKIDKVEIFTRAEVPKSEFLWSLWEALQALRLHNPIITSIEWYACPKQSGVDHPKMMMLPAGLAHKDSKTYRWVQLDDTRRRGVLVIRVTVADHVIYILEVEKTLETKNGVSTLGHLSGLVFKMNDSEQVDKVIGKVLTGLVKNHRRYDKESLPDGYKLFSNHACASTHPMEKAAINAFKLMGITINPCPNSTGGSSSR